MRMISSIAVLMFCASMLVGQDAEESVIRLKQQASETVAAASDLENPDARENPEGAQKPGKWNFSVGTSFSYMKGYGSGMMLYTAPTYSLSLNQRWSVHGGMLASRYQGLNYTTAGENLMPGSYSSLSMFVAASYRMSDKLVIHGTGIKQLVSAPVTPFTPYPIDDIALGATYKLGENFTIGATVHMRNGNGYWGSPLNAVPHASPFHLAPAW